MFYLTQDVFSAMDSGSIVIVKSKGDCVGILCVGILGVCLLLFKNMAFVHMLAEMNIIV